MKTVRRFLLALVVATTLWAGHAHAQMVNAQTGTTYTFLNSDCDPQGRKIVSFSNAAAIAVTLPQAGASGQFVSGCFITVKNVGVPGSGTVTVTPTTSTIDGVTTATIPAGGSAVIYSDALPSGTGNYYAAKGNGVSQRHLAVATDTAPALTSCGGGTPAITGNDVAGVVTMGTSATGCVITFNTAYTNAPYCVVTWIATPLASQSYVTSASAITLTQTSTSTNKVQYICFGQTAG